MSDATFCFALRSPPQLVSVGKDAETLLGYSQEEFLSQKVKLEDRIHAEDAGLAETLFSPEQPEREWVG
jgi:hypothetical protein